MNLEEYLNSGMKARATAQLLAEGMTKQAGIGGTLADIWNMLKRSGKRIGQAGMNSAANAWDKTDSFNALRWAALKGMGKQTGKEIGLQGRRALAGMANHPFATTTATTAGLAAVATPFLQGKAKQQQAQAKTASAEQQPVSLHKYAAELGCPASMRLIAHILEGHGDWLSKVAACAKKNAKCSKIEHKAMPCGK